MPNIKSAIKRVSVIESKTLKNNMIKSEYKTAVKKFEAAVAEGNKEKAQELLKLATKKKLKLLATSSHYSILTDYEKLKLLRSGRCDIILYNKIVYIWNI